MLESQSRKNQSSGSGDTMTKFLLALFILVSALFTTDKAALAQSEIKPLKLPEFKNLSTELDLAPILGGPKRLYKGKIIKLEAEYNESLSLREALEHVLNYNLPIKISRESWQFQRGQLYAKLAGFVPDYSLSYTRTGVRVLPVTRSNTQIYISEVRYPTFLGGSVVYSALGQYYRDKAFKSASKATIDNTLLNAYRQYSNLILQEALLAIREQAVELSKTHLKLNEHIYRSGIGTQLNVMQSRTQLGMDKETLLKQRFSKRNTALGLAYLLHMPLAANLMPDTSYLKIQSIYNKSYSIDDYIELALKNRPELRQFENFQMAARRNVQIAASSLYPTFSFFTAYTYATTGINIPSNLELLNGVAAAEVATAQENIGVVTNTALDQTASFSPGGGNTAKDGANAYATVVAGGGGNPIANVQGGSLVTSGAVKPQFGTSTITGAPSSSNISGANTAGAGVFPGRSFNSQKGFNLGWSLSNMGLSSVANIQASRVLARQAQLQANQELQLIIKQIRTSYMNIMMNERRVNACAFAVASARETLRLARISLNSGVGNNLELITAQKQYISALSRQAQALTSLNQSQAQLLKDIGIISVDTLVEGLKEVRDK